MASLGAFDSSVVAGDGYSTAVTYLISNFKTGF